MPNTYNEPVTKKYLDANGLAYLTRKLNNYPTNDVIAAVIDGVQDALDEKLDVSQKGIPQGVATLDDTGIVLRSQLPPTASARYDTTANWNSKTNFIPDEGEIIIYSDKGRVDDGQGGTKPVPGVKIGDGLAYCVDLPFIDDDTAQLLTNHIRDTVVHVTAAEREAWNNKVDVQLSGEILQFYR